MNSHRSFIAISLMLAISNSRASAQPLGQPTPAKSLPVGRFHFVQRRFPRGEIR